MENQNIIEKYGEQFKSEYEIADSNWHSYDVCRLSFLNSTKESIKEAELNLYAFLANWGMMRNTFLSNRVYFEDNLVEEGLISKLLDYRDGIENILLEDNPNYDILMNLKKVITKHFCDKKQYIRNRETKGQLIEKSILGITDTLATKIMMGTLACVPAYDRYVQKALKSFEKRCSFCEDSLKGIHDLVIDNLDYLVDVCDKLNVSYYAGNTVYTPIKVLDSILWLYGFHLDRNILD